MKSSRPLEQIHPGGTPQLYRPDIDGLRAIAVLAVVGFHAFPGVMRGGFVGVDVFFVISGYLITGIILKGLAQNTFSFLDFYARRVRRLFPALFLMLLCIFVFGWFTLLPDEFAALGKHMLGGAGFISNILYWQESGYFDTSSHAKPLLHLWSLGVEEQFYLFFPILLYLIWKNRNNIFFTVLIFFVFSFFYNIFIHKSNHVADFYSPIARFWEIFSGSMIAVVNESYPSFWDDLKSKIDSALATILGKSQIGDGNLASSVLSVLGGGLIIIAVLTTREGRFPGYRALLPVAGAFLILLAGRQGWFNRKILSCKPAVAIGLVSYPLYLWHWPLLSYVYIINGGYPNIFVRICAVVASFVLAVLTYIFVEKQIRFYPTRKKYYGLCISSILISVLGVGAYMQNITPQSRFVSFPDFSIPYYKTKVYVKSPEFSSHIIPGERITLFCGDSNMDQFMPRIITLLQDKSVNKGAERGMVSLTKYGYPPIPGLLSPWLSEGETQRFWEVFDDTCQKQSVDTVVLAAAWFRLFRGDYIDDVTVDGVPLYSSEGKKLLLRNLSMLIKKLHAQGKKVYIISNIPIDLEDLHPRKAISRTILSVSINMQSGIWRDTLLDMNREAFEAIKQVSLENGAFFIDPTMALCPRGFCPAVTPDGTFIYWDGGHLAPTYTQDRYTFLDDLILTP